MLTNLSIKMNLKCSVKKYRDPLTRRFPDHLTECLAYHIWAVLLPPSGHEVRAILDLASFLICRISVSEILPLGGVGLDGCPLSGKRFVCISRARSRTLGGKALSSFRVVMNVTFCACYGISFTRSISMRKLVAFRRHILK